MCMSAYLKKGIAVWILGSLTLLVFLNTFNTVLLWTLYGSDLEIEPYLIGQFTGEIQVLLYLWISVVAAFILFGCTTVVAFRKPMLDPALIEMLRMINSQLAANKEVFEQGLEVNRKAIETVETRLLERVEAQKRANEEFLETLRGRLRSIKEEMFDALEIQGKGLHKVSRELSSAIERHISDVEGEVLGALAKQEEVMRRAGRSSKRSVRTIEKGLADLAEMKTRLETLETALALPQPKLKSSSSPKVIKGVGPRLTEELKAMGITNVGEFLIADPTVIDTKTRLTREKAKRLQGTAQLQMILGIDKTDIELLEKAGVTNRRELAKRDPFILCKKIAEVAKTYVEMRKISEAERPTVEEVLSWVKLAKF